MSINVNGVTLPDIPVVEGCSYAAIVCEDNSRYLLFLSNSQMLMFPKSVSGQYVDFLVDMATVAAQYESTGEAWTLMAEQSPNTYVPLGDLAAIGGTSATLVWSNHDVATITWFDSNDDTNFTTGEIYFPSSVASEPRIEATRLVTTVTYEGLPETAPTISTNFIDETYPYGALFEDNSTWWIVVSSQPIVYKSSESYNFNTNGHYKVYLWVVTDELSLWVETDASIWFPIKSVYDFSLIWSNHDILSNADNSVYFSKTGDVKVTTEEKTISFPAVPTEWVETYPYCCIGEMTIYGTKYCYLTLSTNTCGYIPPSLVEINQSLGGIYIPPCNVVYMYDEATATWVYEGEYVRETVMYDGYAHQLSISGVFWWSNHDIYVLSEDEQEQPVPTDEVYFHGTGVIEPPEQMAVDRIFIVSSAANLRRLTATTDKFTTDDMITGLSGYTPAADPTLQDITITKNGTYTADNAYDGFGTVTVSTPGPTKTSWIAEIECRTDYTTTPYTTTITSQTDDIYVPLGISCSFQQATNFSVVADFPQATKMSGYGYAFKNSPALKSFYAPLLTEISSSAFANCAALNSVHIPEVLTIGVSAFNGCSSLASIDFPVATEIGNYAFGGCTALKSVNMPNVITLGNQVFASCSSLVSIELPAAKTIGVQAVSMCDSLEKVDLGAAESIHSMAFALNNKLSTVIIRTTSAVCKLLATDDTTEGYASHFANHPTVYVPSALINQYKANAAWIEAMSSPYNISILAIEDYPDICG